MTKTPHPSGFQLSSPDPALLLPTIVSSKAGLKGRQAPAGASNGGLGTSPIGLTRPIPSLIALRGLVGLPDPAVTPDYSALQALVDAASTRSAVPPPATGKAPQPQPQPPTPVANSRSTPIPDDVERLSPPLIRTSTKAGRSARSGLETANPKAGPTVEAPTEAFVSVTSTEAAATPSVQLPKARFLDSTGEFLGVSRARFDGLRRVSSGDGSLASPSAGGRVESPDGEPMLLLRKPAPAHDGMNDFIAGMLARAALADAPWVVPLAIDGDTWLASPRLPDAIDLNDFAQAGESDAAMSGTARCPDSHELTRRIVRAFEHCKGRGLEENVAFAMLVGADEQHSGHFVVTLRPDGDGSRQVQRVVRNDGASASRGHQRLHRIRSNYFDHQMHPPPTPRRLPGHGPNQHRVDVPRELRCSAPYIEALLALSRIDMSEAVHLAFLEAAHSWSDDVCRAFAVNANLRLPTRRWTHEALFDECGRAYRQRIEARQKSMQRYAADLAIGLANVTPLTTAPANVLPHWHPHPHPHPHPQSQPLPQPRALPPSQTRFQPQAVTLITDADGVPLIDAFLRQPETRPSIDAWLRREPGAARQRNLALDRHDEALRRAVAARLDVLGR